MKFVKVIEHNGEIYRIGDEIEVVFDNGTKASGKIKGFDTYGFLESGMADGITFGKYCVPFTDIVEMKKVTSSEIMNFAVAVLAEVAECAKQEDAPIYIADVEDDYFVRLSDVNKSINKYLNS